MHGVPLCIILCCISQCFAVNCKLIILSLPCLCYMLEFNVLSYVATGKVGLVTKILKDHDQNTDCHCNLVPHAAMGCVSAGLSKIDNKNRRLFSNAVYFPE